MDRYDAYAIHNSTSTDEIAKDGVSSRSSVRHSSPTAITAVNAPKPLTARNSSGMQVLAPKIWIAAAQAAANAKATIIRQ